MKSKQTYESMPAGTKLSARVEGAEELLIGEQLRLLADEPDLSKEFKEQTPAIEVLRSASNWHWGTSKP